MQSLLNNSAPSASDDQDLFSRPDSPKGKDSASKDCLPLSFAQQRLWFLDQVAPNTPLYNVPFALHLRGKLEQTALHRALQEIVNRHEALRTNFRCRQGIPCQVIRDRAVISLRIVDVRKRAASQPGVSLEAFLSQEARRPFNLSEDLLVRTTLWPVGEEEQVLLFCFHHIVCDEWSLQTLFKELVVLYNAFVSMQEPGLPELQIQYGDYTLWQRDTLAKSAIALDLEYWRQKLSGAPLRVAFNAEKAASSGVEPHAGDSQSIILPSRLVQALALISRQEGVTLFITLLTAFKALLHRYTTQDEICLGTPFSGRDRLETEAVIGFFVNTLALRTDVSGNPQFLALLGRVKQTTLEAYQHPQLPFEKLVEELHPHRSHSQVPFVNVMFAYEQALEESQGMLGLDIRQLDVTTLTAKFDLTWVVRNRSSGLEVCAEFSTALFRRETVAQMLDHWQIFLEGISANPSARIAEIPLCRAEDRKRAVVEWNQTARTFPAESSLAELFKFQVERTPDAIAVRYGSCRLTYRELAIKSDRIAGALRTQGLAAGGLVGLCFGRSADFIVAMLGVVKAGGAYLPLDPDYPPERLKFMLEDARAQLILTQDQWAKALPSVDAKIICLNSLSLSAESSVGAEGKLNDLAYVIYTSGSTGRPKGILVPQRAVVRLACGTDYVQLTDRDKVAQASNLSFDAATFEIWGALLNGGTLVGIESAILLRPKELAAELAREEITTLFLSTALFNQIASEAPDAFRTIKHLLFGGETVDPKWVWQVIRHQPPERLLHVYGPTETTTFASWHLVTQVDEETRTIPIGRPIANTRLYLLDAGLNPVPPGVPGEIYIGGPGLAQGYLHAPELTAEKFIPDPFSERPGERLFKTGDLGRYRSNGDIEFLGRLDGQVKIRGFRVESGEVQSVIKMHPAVRDAIVLGANGDSTTGRKLVAYLVLRPNSGPSELKGVCQAVKEELPAYMVPSAWVRLEQMPLNANGKIDLKALPSPEVSQSRWHAAPAAPRSETERNLIAIWRDVLELDTIGVHDNFFEIGGHSLLAVRLFSAIEKELGTSLPLATLFKAPTVAQLAAFLERGVDRDIARSLFAEIQPEGSRPPFFWVHSLGGDGGGAFFYYRALARLLGTDQPSYGIRSPLVPFTSMEEMAVHYVDELLKFQPAGPYFLGGFCFGGLVAYEMARELSARGRDIGLLVLLESAAPGRTRWRWQPGVIPILAGNLRSWFSDLKQQNPANCFRRLRRKTGVLAKRLVEFLGPMRSTPRQLEDSIDVAEYPKDYLRYAQAHWQALLEYTPQPYRGRLTLFRARKQPLFCVDPTLGWGELAGEGVAVNIIPGTHEKMLEDPNVQILAAELKACLVEAQSRLVLADVELESSGSEIDHSAVASWSCSIIT